MNFLKNLNKKRIIVVTHVFASGPAQALLEYLTKENRAKEVLYIGHPLFYQPQKVRGSFWELYENGRLSKKCYLKNIDFPMLIAYIKDVLLSVWWVIKTRRDWDLIVCADNLNTLAGIILRGLRRVNKVVFWTVDYVPQRFENRFLNEIYHLIDRISVYQADAVWNLSPRMEEARKKFRGIKTNPGKQKVVPIGIWYERIKKAPLIKAQKDTLIFMGHLIEKQGVQSVLGAIPQIVRKIPDFRFIIIGTGPYERQLKVLVKKLKIEKYVKFTGYIESHQEMESLMATGTCAVALYQKQDRQRNFTYYSDPAKIKNYLGAGLPVILTNVPHNATDLVDRKCGLIVGPEPDSVAKAVVSLLKNEKKLLEYRRNAVKYAQQFDWANIFETAFVDNE